MSDFLNSIRCVDKKISVKRQIINTVIIMLTGVALGVISKCLDCTAANDLPFIINYLDTRNFLGRFPIWIVQRDCHYDSDWRRVGTCA